MTAQMIAEAKVPYDKATQGPKNKPQFLIHEDPKPPKNEVMKDRGGGFDESQPPTVTNNKDDTEPTPIVVTELTDLLMPWETSKPNQHASTPTNGNRANDAAYHPAS